MALRTSVGDTKLIFDTTMSDAQITAFITTANLIVTENLGSSSLSADRLEEIEKWLAAHLASTRDQRQQSRTIDGRTVLTFQGKTGTGLNSTYYGQMVLMLDITGTLALISEGLKKASIEMIDATDPQW